MTNIEGRTVGIIALAVLAGCRGPEAAPPANVAQNETVVNDQGTAQVEHPLGAPDMTTAEQANMSSNPGRRSAATPAAPPPSPSAPPKPEVRPAPEQPPAEVDPPHRHPGDEVPR